jgi:multiple sugar transport system permease protein
MTDQSPSIPTNSRIGLRQIRRWLDFRFGSIALAPTVIILLALTVFPLIYLVSVSFKHLDSGDPTKSHFVGLDNFSRLLSDTTFHNALLNTIVYCGVAVSVEIVLGMALALLVHSVIGRLDLFRTFLLIPVMLPPIAVAISWKLMYNPQFGIINDILYRLGIEDFLYDRGIINGPILWASSPATAMLSIIIVDVWQSTPFVFLMFLAGLASLPSEPYEAAELDGAGFWRKFRDLTLPLLRPLIGIVFLFRLLDSLRAFDIIYIVTRGGPAEATDTLGYYIYRVAFQFFDLGYAGVLSILMLLLTILLSVFVLSRVHVDVE